MLKIAHCRDCSLADFVQGAVNVATAKVKVETQNRREIKRPNTSKALSDSSLEYLICSSQSLQTGLEVCHSFVTSHGKEIAAKKNKVDRNQNNTYNIYHFGREVTLIATAPLYGVPSLQLSPYRFTRPDYITINK